MSLFSGLRAHLSDWLTSHVLFGRGAAMREMPLTERVRWLFRGNGTQTIAGAASELRAEMTATASAFAALAEEGVIRRKDDGEEHDAAYALYELVGA